MALFAILSGIGKMVTTVISIVLWFSEKQLENVASYLGLNNVCIYKEIDVELIEKKVQRFICT